MYVTQRVRKMSDPGRCVVISLLVLLAGCATGSLQKRDDMYQMAVAMEKWVIQFPARGFEVQTADHSKPYYFFTNDKSGLAVSFNFDEARRCKDSESCRDYLADRQKATLSYKKNWRMTKIGDVYVSENMNGPIEGMDLRQQHMNAHYVKGWIWIDVHLSKVNYRNSDRQLFVDFVRSIQIRDK